MINIKRVGLDFYVDRISRGERTVFSRWGDGEWYCVFLKTRKVSGLKTTSEKQNCDGTLYTPKLSKELRNVLCRQKDYLWGIQSKAAREMKAKIEPFLSINKIVHDWYWSDVFHDANCKGRLFPLVQCCRNLKIINVGPKHLSSVQQKIFGGAVAKYIEFPLPAKVENVRDIFNQLQKSISHEKPDLIGFSAGMIANILIDQIYDICDCHILDFGSIWDVYCGVKSRAMFRNQSCYDWKNIMNKNLGQ